MKFVKLHDSCGDPMWINMDHVFQIDDVSADAKDTGSKLRSKLMVIGASNRSFVGDRFDTYVSETPEEIVANEPQKDPERDYDDLFWRSMDVALALGDAKKMIHKLADALDGLQLGAVIHRDLIADARAMAGYA